MEMIFRIIELVICLEWTLDLIDLYDKRLAEIDGSDSVYNEVHVKAKEQARKMLEQYKQMPGYKDVTRPIGGR